MILTVAFSKGGVAKTTTAAAIANAARMNNRTVLALDLDPQNNLSFIMGADLQQSGIDEVLTGQKSIDKVIQKVDQGCIITAGKHLDILTESINPATLRDALKGVSKAFDLIVIDTPPTLNRLVTSALNASDDVLLPMQANVLSMQELYRTNEIINKIRSGLNPQLKIAGIVLTKYKPRQLLAKQMHDVITQYAAQMQTKVFNAYIREGIAADQACAMRQSIFDYAPNSNPAVDYMELYNEMKI